MDTPAVTAQATTNAATPNVEVKTGATMLGSPKEPAAQVDPKPADATVKADADASKTPEQVKADADKAAADKAKSEGAPEKYEFKTAESVKLDEAAVTEFSTVAKELNLSQDNAQKFIDMATKHTEKLTTQLRQASEKALSDAGEAWLKEIHADKEFGGANLKTSNEAAIRFRNKFANPQEQKALSALFDSGWGNNPTLWRMFVRAGKALGEDQAVDGTLSSPEMTAARVMFPSMK